MVISFIPWVTYIILKIVHCITFSWEKVWNWNSLFILKWLFYIIVCYLNFVIYFFKNNKLINKFNNKDF